MSGIGKLYAMISGTSTLFEPDIDNIYKKAASMGIIDSRQVYKYGVIRNCAIYGEMLLDYISNRLGNIPYEAAVPNFSDDTTRLDRSFYFPPETLVVAIKRLKTPGTGQSLEDRLSDLAITASFHLTTLQSLGMAAASSNTPTYMATLSASEHLLKIIECDCTTIGEAKAALQILMVIAKLLSGDISNRSMIEQANRTNIDRPMFAGEAYKCAGINISDATLSAIPFPTGPTIGLFQEPDEVNGVSMKGQAYLDAISLYTFKELK